MLWSNLPALFGAIKIPIYGAAISYHLVLVKIQIFGVTFFRYLVLLKIPMYGVNNSL